MIVSVNVASLTFSEVSALATSWASLASYWLFAIASIYRGCASLIDGLMGDFSSDSEEVFVLDGEGVLVFSSEEWVEVIG